MKRLSVFCLISLFFLCPGCMQRYYNTATQQEEIYFYSTEKELKIGEALVKEVENRFNIEPDELIQQRVRQIGERLAAASERKDVRYHFKVLDEKEANAFALPGGYVYLFNGLLNKIDKSDEQIAAVLAHEIAHVDARHSIKRLQNVIGYSALSILVTATATDTYSRVKANIGINELLLAYSREDELEADTLAVRYLAKAGYEPEAAIEILKIIQDIERNRPIRPRAAPTHPYVTDRIRVIKEQINKGNINFDDYINTTQ